MRISFLLASLAVQMFRIAGPGQGPNLVLTSVGPKLELLAERHVRTTLSRQLVCPVLQLEKVKPSS